MSPFPVDVLREVTVGQVHQVRIEYTIKDGVSRDLVVKTFTSIKPELAMSPQVERS